MENSRTSRFLDPASARDSIDLLGGCRINPSKKRGAAIEGDKPNTPNKERSASKGGDTGAGSVEKCHHVRLSRGTGRAQPEYPRAGL